MAGGASLSGKVAIVTGVSSGFGWDVAHGFAVRGAHVVGVARREERGKLLEAELRRAGLLFDFVAGDVTRPDDCQRVVDRAVAIGGGVQILVNNAGVGGPVAPVEDLEPDAWDAVLGANLKGTFLMCRSVLPVMYEADDGVILNVASINALEGVANLAAYNASKAGVVQLSRTLAVEAVSRGVRVNAIVLGGVPSEMNSELKQAMGRTIRGPDWSPSVPAAAHMSGEDATRRARRAVHGRRRRHHRCRHRARRGRLGRPVGVLDDLPGIGRAPARLTPHEQKRAAMSATDRHEIDFDHHSPEYAEHHLEIYKDLRTRCPVAHTDAHGGYWLVTRYDDVTTVARDDQTYSSQWKPDGCSGVVIPATDRPHVPIETDPPELQKYRRILNPMFSPAAAQRWRPNIERWTALCLDVAIERGEFDLVNDLGNPVPGLFTCELLGLPLEDWERYAGPFHRAVYTPPTADRSQLFAEMAWIMESLAELVARRRREPQDDMISILTQAEIDGQPIPDEVVVNICDLVMAGGFDTTTAATSSALWHLHHDHADRQRLIDDPTLLPVAVEEWLRYYAPTQALARTVTEDTELGGQQLSAGDRVLVSWASANHDDTEFEDPEAIVIDRLPNPHTAFGVGAHRCLGMHFARAEIVAMVGAVLDRMPDYEVIEDQAEPYTTIGIVNGWITMPARFTPGTRRSAESLPGAR